MYGLYRGYVENIFSGNIFSGCCSFRLVDLYGIGVRDTL